MKLSRRFLVLAALPLMAVPSVLAEKRPATFDGTLACAKCVHKEAAAKTCQDVLTMTNGPLVARYYVQPVDPKTATPPVAAACKGNVVVRIVGTAERVDDKLVLYSTQIIMGNGR